MPTKLKVRIKKLRENVKLPDMATDGDACFDCYISKFADVNGNEILSDSILLPSGARVLCALGFSTEFPSDYYAEIRPRSGLAIRNGIDVVLGTIDSGYRGEWSAIVRNLSPAPIGMKYGNKICQIIFKQREIPEIEIVDTLAESDRGKGGFGSSDKNEGGKNDSIQTIDENKEKVNENSNG